MEKVSINGAEIEYEVRGSGDPLLLIHGAILADAFLPLMIEPSIASNYQVIYHHRRGFAGSVRATSSLTIKERASDCLALLGHLGVPQTHVVGHSYGGLIALQCALDAPDQVISLALLEPALFGSAPSAPEFMQAAGPVVEMYESGDKVGAVDGFLNLVGGPDFRKVIDEVLPPGAFDLAVSDIDTWFQSEMPSFEGWSFTAEEAKDIRQPVLSVVGDETIPIFRECHDLIKQWIPQTEELGIPQATHGLQMMNPRAVAESLAGFLARHKP